MVSQRGMSQGMGWMPWRAASRRLIGWGFLPFTRVMRFSFVFPFPSQSEVSPCGGRPGSCRICTVLAIPFSASVTCFAWAWPGGSLSGRMTTFLPRNDSEYSGLHLPAPPGEVVAVRPSFSSVSTSFSPSTMKMGSWGSEEMMCWRW